MAMNRKSAKLDPNSPEFWLRRMFYAFNVPGPDGSKIARDPESLSEKSAQSKFIEKLLNLLVNTGGHKQAQLDAILNNPHTPWSQIIAFCIEQVPYRDTSIGKSCRELLILLARENSAVIKATGLTDEQRNLRKQLYAVFRNKEIPDELKEKIKANLLNVDQIKHASSVAEVQLEWAASLAGEFKTKKKGDPNRKKAVKALHELFSNKSPEDIVEIIENVNFPWEALFDYTIPSKLGESKEEDDQGYPHFRELLINMGKLFEYVDGKKIKITEDSKLKAIRKKLVEKLPKIPDPDLQDQISKQITIEGREFVLMELNNELKTIKKVPPVDLSLEDDRKAAQAYDESRKSFNHLLLQSRIHVWDPDKYAYFSRIDDRVALLASIKSAVVSIRVLTRDDEIYQAEQKGDYAKAKRIQKEVAEALRKDKEYEKLLQKLAEDIKKYNLLEQDYEIEGAAELIEDAEIDLWVGQEYRKENIRGLTRSETNFFVEVKQEVDGAGKKKLVRKLVKRELDEKQEQQVTGETVRGAEAAATLISLAERKGDADFRQDYQTVQRKVVESVLNFSDGERLIRILEGTDESAALYESKLREKLEKDKQVIQAILSVDPKQYGPRTREFFASKIANAAWQDAAELSAVHMANLFAINEKAALDFVEKRRIAEEQARHVKKRSEMEEQARPAILECKAIIDIAAKRVGGDKHSAAQFKESCDEFVAKKLEKLKIDADAAFEMEMEEKNELFRLFIRRFPSDNDIMNTEQYKKIKSPHEQKQYIANFKQKYIDDVKLGLAQLGSRFVSRLEEGQSLVTDQIGPYDFPLNLFFMAMTGETTAPFRQLTGDSFSQVTDPALCRSTALVEILLNSPSVGLTQITRIVQLASPEQLTAAANNLYKAKPVELAWGKLLALTNVIPPQQLSAFIKSLEPHCRSYILSQYIAGHVLEHLKGTPEGTNLSVLALEHLAEEFKELGGLTTPEEPSPLYLISVAGELGVLQEHLKAVGVEFEKLTDFAVKIKEVAEKGKFESGEVEPAEFSWKRLKALKPFKVRGKSAGSAFYFIKFLQNLLAETESNKIFEAQELAFLKLRLEELDKEYHWRDKEQKVLGGLYAPAQRAVEGLVTRGQELISGERSHRSEVVAAQADLDFNTSLVLHSYLQILDEKDSTARTSLEESFVANFIKKNPNFPGSIAFLLTSDEEGPTNKNGTKRVIEELVKRGENIDYSIIGEATSETKLGDQIRVGRRGSLSGKLTIEGKQGHVAFPENADNPIHAAVGAIKELTTTIWDRGNEFFPPTTFQISNIHAGTGATNVIPGKLEILFNFRFSTAVTVDELQRRVLEILVNHSLSFDLKWELSGHPFLTKQGKLIDATKNAIKKITNLEPKLSTGGGTSDGRFIAPTGAEVIELGPINKTVHQVNECIKIEDLDTLQQVYQQILENIFEK